MFNSNHYVPILKWKRAEQGALKLLSVESKSVMTPLIQLVMPNHKSTEKLEDVVTKSEKIAPEVRGKIIDVWGTAPVFIDVSLLFTTPLKVSSLITVCNDPQSIGGMLIPVIYMSDEEEIKNISYSIVKKTGSGLCLRITDYDFLDIEMLNKNINSILTESGLSEREVDIIVDIKEHSQSAQKYRSFLDLSQKIIRLQKWRTFTFAGGSFPEDLSECKFAEKNLIPRIEWTSWHEYVHVGTLLRKPSFADYSIQHPVYKYSTQFFHPTSSIKYTLDENWLIKKGKKQKFELYLASAAEMVTDERFYGAGFSAGDTFIANKAQHFPVYMKDQSIKGTGSTETWLRAGINHHLTVVAHQIANLA
jgi:hypothetical protein